jgi:hypothetical protein
MVLSCDVPGRRCRALLGQVVTSQYTVAGRYDKVRNGWGQKRLENE